jgi:hypothetical protein
MATARPEQPLVPTARFIEVAHRDAGQRVEHGHARVLSIRDPSHSAPSVAVPGEGVPGPPKLFAQGIGAALSTVGLALALGGVTTAAYVCVGLIAVAATLESLSVVCLGCTLFALQMRAGVIPASVCEECNDLWLRRAA